MFQTDKEEIYVDNSTRTDNKENEMPKERDTCFKTFVLKACLNTDTISN